MCCCASYLVRALVLSILCLFVVAHCRPKFQAFINEEIDIEVNDSIFKPLVEPMSIIGAPVTASNKLYRDVMLERAKRTTPGQFLSTHQVFAALQVASYHFASITSQRVAHAVLTSNFSHVALAFLFDSFCDCVLAAIE